MRLGDVCDIVKGEQLNRDTLAETGAIPVYNGGAAPSGYADRSNTDAENVIISEGGNSCGYVNFIHVPFWRGGHCYLLYTKLDKTLLYYVLKAQETKIMSLRVGTGLPNIQRERLNAFEIDLPIDEKNQRRIAASLSAIDTHISALAALIAKYEAIKKATVNLLLRPKAGWRQVKIKDFCPLQRGFDLPKHSRHRGVFPLVCSNGVSDRIDKYLVKAPGVVTGRSGTIGNVHFLGENFWPHNTTLWVSRFIDADPLFVFYLLSELGLSRFSGGSGVPTLNRNDVHETLVEVPSITKQHEIAEQIATIGKTIFDCKAQLEKARQLKSGMMSYFFG